MTYILTVVIASGSLGLLPHTLRFGGSGGEAACYTRLMVELDRAHRRGERVVEAECKVR
jgi:hypothetical protein